jgi:hypothetical protein
MSNYSVHLVIFYKDEILLFFKEHFKGTVWSDQICNAVV